MKKFKIIILSICIFLLNACAYNKTMYCYTVYPIDFIINSISNGYVFTRSIQDNVNVQNSSIVEDYNKIFESSKYLFHIGKLENYINVYEKELEKYQVEKVDLSYLNTIYQFKRTINTTVKGEKVVTKVDYYQSSLFDNVETNEIDYNTWLDPSIMLTMSKNIYNVLYSDHIEKYDYFTLNYKALNEKLLALEERFNSFSKYLQANNKTLKFATITASFGCWQDLYNFEIYPICISKSGTLPTEEQYQYIKQELIDNEVKFISYESNIHPDLKTIYDRLINELGLTPITLHNLSSITSEQKEQNKDYISLMYENLKNLELMVD